LPVTQGVAGRAGCILEYGFVLKRTRGFANTARTRPARRRLDSWERASKASRSSTLLPPNRRWEGLGGGSGTSLSYHRHKGHTIQAMHMRKRLSGSGCTCSKWMAPWQADQSTHETIKHNSSRKSQSECVRDGGADTDFAASRSRTSGDEGVSPGLRSSQLFVVTSWHCVCLQLLSSKISLRINALLV